MKSRITEVMSTLNMIFSVTYYLDLHNVITVYCASHFFFTNYGQIVHLHTIEQ